MCAPVGSTSSVPLENGDKERKEFLKRMNHYSNPVFHYISLNTNQFINSTVTFA
jgi:hypothetical protein